MDNILDAIIANKKIEVEAQKQSISQDSLIKEIETRGVTVVRNRFRDNLKNSDTGIISEFKRRSPSRGWIFESAKVEEVIPKYTQGGASAISVLTDFNFFGGNLNDLITARGLTDTPLLRKDFTIDEYQIYEAALHGASAILLIASALTIDQTKIFAKKAQELNLDVLLEIHNEEELKHINEYVDVVGVNNRNLSTFVTDVKVSFDLVDKIPDDFIKISESGISNTSTVKELQSVGYKGFLMGENFMKTDDPGKALTEFIEELRK